MAKRKPTNQPSNKKRNRKHGFLKRMQSKGGRKTINQRRKKGRKHIVHQQHRK